MVKLATALVCIASSFVVNADGHDDSNPFWEQNDTMTGPVNKPVDHTNDTLDPDGDRCWAIQQPAYKNSNADGQMP